MSRDWSWRLRSVLVLTLAKRGAVITESRSVWPTRVTLRSVSVPLKSWSTCSVAMSVSVFS